MAIADETTLRIVLYEGEGAASLEASDRTATVSALLEQGYAVTCAGEGAVAGGGGNLAHGPLFDLTPNYCTKTPPLIFKKPPPALRRARSV